MVTVTVKIGGYLYGYGYGLRFGSDLELWLRLMVMSNIYRNLFYILKIGKPINEGKLEIEGIGYSLFGVSGYYKIENSVTVDVISPLPIYHPIIIIIIVIYMIHTY